MKNLRRRAGFTLVEVVLAMTVFALVALSIAQAISFFSTQGTRTREKEFATQKVIQMMEELRSVVSGNGSIAILDTYNDGLKHNPVLTTNLSVTDPADPSSGNGAGLLYRIVTVVPMANDQTARQVYVRVYDAASNTVLAQAMSVLRTLPSAFSPSQVYDVYFIAVDNVPGWWILTAKLKPILDGVLQNLQAVNPGLVLRSHWVTTMSYGRDPYYTPWINKATWGTAESATLPYVYLYAGWTTNTNLGTEYYYDPTKMYGQLSVGASPSLGMGPNTNVGSFNYADEFNHAVRYPDEQALYNTIYSSDVAAGISPPEVSLRMLLEEMNASSSPVQNLLLMNLHGEMLPMPPVRNYSDAAKDPINLPGQRVVTHPELLQYASGAGVNLRVYAYMTPDFVDATPTTVVVSTISVFLPISNPALVAGTPIPASAINVRQLVNAGGFGHYSWGSGTPPLATAATCVSGAGGVVPTPGNTYCVYVSTMGTEIVLANTPVRQSTSTAALDGTGLMWQRRLYGMEYIPSATAVNGLTAGTTQFAEGIRDLTDVSTVAKNTARWVIQFAPGALANGQFQVQTRIGADLTTGFASVGNHRSNQSNTYIWVGSTPPVTEKYQYMGDPRFEPYADAKYQNRYNWEFVDLSTDTRGPTYAYLGYENTNPTGTYGGGCGWGASAGTANNPCSSPGTVSYDAPRFYQLYRKGLLNANGLWTTMTGWSFYYAAIGGDLGDDGTLGYTAPGIPMDKHPWNPGVGGTADVNEIVNDAGNPPGYTYKNAKLIAAATNYWAANPWVGELYPDTAFAGANGWAAIGNLPTGASATTGFYRADYTTVFGVGNSTFSYLWKPEKRVGPIGAPSYLDASPLGNGASWFQHSGVGGDTCPLTAVGSAMSSVFNYPLLPSLTATRPWQMNSGASQPPQWNTSTYITQYTSSSIVSTNYSDTTTPALTCSGLVKIVPTTAGTLQGAYLAVNGVPAQTSFGSNDIAQLSLVTMLYGFLQAGAGTNVDPVTVPGAIHQIPLVAISTPSVSQQFVNPTSVTIGWGAGWTRWGGQPYLPSYPVGFTDPSVALNYNVKYSQDNGATWKFVGDNTPAQWGVFNSTEAATTVNPTVWNVSNTAMFPQGYYLFDVEGYRGSQFPLHFTYEEQQLFIQR